MRTRDRELVKNHMKTREGEKARFWDKVLFEILESKYVTEQIGSVKADIEAGKKAFENSNHAMPYGFGQGCYYETKRKLVEDAVYQFFDEDTEEQSKTLAEWIVKQVKESLQYKVADIKDVKDCVGSRMGRATIEVSVDYSEILRDARDEVQDALEEHTDEEIEEYVSKVKTAEDED